MFPREHEVGKFGPRAPGAPWNPCWDPRSRGGRRRCATSVALAEAAPGLPQRPLSGTVRGRPSVPSSGEAVSAGRPGAVAARRATYPPGAQSGPRAQGRVLGSHLARPQAWVSPPSHTRPDTPDAGSRRVPGTLTRVFAPPLGNHAASRWPSPAPRGGGASARASPGAGGRGGAGLRVEPDAAALPRGTGSQPPPRVPPAQCSCARGQPL